MSLLQPPRIPEIADRSRITHDRPTIAIVDALPGAPLATELASRLGPRALRTRLLIRHKPGFDLQAGGAASHPDSLLEATRALLASLPEHDVLLAEGAALLATMRSRLAILGTPSPSLTTLDPDVRAQRDRFGLVLYDLRPKVLGALADALSC